jgi:hypothetical protein
MNEETKEKKSLITVPNFDNVDLGVMACVFIIAISAVSAGCILVWGKIQADIAVFAILFSFFSSGLTAVVSLVNGYKRKTPPEEPPTG